MILVTGGTGFVGREVIGELLARGYRVRLLVRHPERATDLKKLPGVELVAGDVLKPETLAPAMTGVEAVIHLVGIIAETSHVTFEQAHREATRHVLTAAKQAGVTRYIHMSAAGTRAHARSRYHITKWEAEELVRQSGMDWTIFQPSLIYGYDGRDRLLNFLRTALSLPFNLMPLIDGGRSRVQPVSVREVARCFAHAVINEASLGRTYELVGPVAFSWREMVVKMAHALGKGVLHENVVLGFFTRVFLWLTVLLMPFLVIKGLATGKMSLPVAEILAVLEAFLFVIAMLWRKLIIVSIPVGLLRTVSRIADAIAPRSLRFSEQLKMAEEDNVGNPCPAAQTFAYEPESFEQGIARLLDHSQSGH